MSKYIKLDDAIRNINLEVTGRKEYTGDMKANLFFALDDLPTIDIVTCEECRYKDNCMRCVDQWNFYDDGIVESSLSIRFCSEGERKDK